MREVPCGAYGSGTRCATFVSWEEGRPRQRAKSRASRVGGLHQSQSRRFTNSVAALLSTRTKQSPDNHAHISHTHAPANTNGNDCMSGHRMQAPGQSPSYWLGQGTDPSITDTCHSKSCLCCGSLFVASSAIPDRKRTTDDPIAHFPRLSFRTSFSFSPFGFSSVPFVTRYQPVAQSLFHTLSHQGRLGGTCHWVSERTREPRTFC